MAFKWTEPYCGVQHLITSRPRPQLTVEDHGSFAEAYVLGLSGFTPIAKDTFHRDEHEDPVAAARAWLEQQAAAHGVGVG